MNMIAKPWGWERIIEQNAAYVVKLIFIKAGHRLSLQYHKLKRETLTVIDDGWCHAVIDGSVKMLSHGESLTIASGQSHRLGASTAGVLLLECSTPELDDVVRLADDYGRAGP